MDAPNQDFARAGGLEELKQKGRLLVNVAIVRSS